MKSILESKKALFCYICGSPKNLEEHHIFGGPDRNMSERFGLKVHLCDYCHRDSTAGVHFNRENQEYLFIEGKRAFQNRFPELRWLDYFRKEYVDFTLCETTLDEPQAAGFLMLKTEEKLLEDIQEDRIWQ